MGLKRVLKQLFWTVSEQGASSILMFTTGILLARSTSKEDFGVYVLALSVVMVIIGFQKALITTPYAIMYNQESNKERLTRLSFSFQAIFFIFILILFLASLILNLLVTNDISITFILCSFLYLVGQTFLTYYKSTLIAEMKVRSNFFYCISTYSLILISLIVLYSVGVLNTNLTLIIFGLATCIVSIAYFIFFGKNNFIFDREELITQSLVNWKLGKWIVCSNIAYIFSSQIIPFVLAYSWGSNSVAEFGVLLSITRIFSPAVQGVSSYMLPKITTYTGDQVKFKKILTSVLLIMIFISGVLVLLGYYFGEELINIMYTSKYENLSEAVLLAFIVQAIIFITMPVDAGTNALRRTDIGFQGLIIGAVTTIFIGIPVIMNFGVSGALMAMIISALASLVYRAYRLDRIIKGIK